MKKVLLSFSICLAAFSLCAQKQVEWVSTTESSQWNVRNGLFTIPVSGKSDVEILLNNPLHTIKGFGACFNELGCVNVR
jgi:hypothetical protein